jgi:hypothetical protein
VTVGAAAIADFPIFLASAHGEPDFFAGAQKQHFFLLELV